MMSDSTRVMRRRRGRLPAARAAAAIIATAALALPAAACGSGSPSSTGSGGTSSAYAAHALAFARCVRAHGMPDFPDPDSRGVFPKAALPGVSVSRIRAAERPCSNLLTGGQPPLTARDQQDYLKAAACMRSHGITGFPDPVFSRGSVSFPIPSSIDTRSQRFAQDRRTCAKLIPAGLPYSGNSGSGG